jgi:phosphoribosylpyrophosphate synthetase
MEVTRSSGCRLLADSAAATHSLLVEGAYERLKAAGMSALISTDTVPGPYSSVSVAPVLVRAISP